MLIRLTLVKQNATIYLQFLRGVKLMTKKLIPLGLTSDGKNLVLGPAGDCASGYARVENLVGFFTPPF